MFDLGIPFDDERAATRRRPHQPGAPHVADRRHAGVPRRLQVRRRLHLHAAAGRRRSGTRWPTSSTTTRCTTASRPSDVTVVGAIHATRIDKHRKGDRRRGVLLDIARLKGVDWLELGYVITPDDLEAAIAAQGDVEVGPGDILAVPHRVASHSPGRRDRRPSSWPASPASGRTAASGCTTARSPRSCSRQLGDRGAARREPRARSSTCTWCSSATWA